MNNIFIGLVNNAALLLSLGLIFDVFIKREKHATLPLLHRLITGLIIGLIAVILMATPVKWETGIIFDTRTILLGLTGLFFGTIPALLAIAIATIYRLTIGGSGTVMGVATIISSGLLGLVWRHYRFRNSQELSLSELYLFGTAVHAAMILCMFLLPQEVIQKALSTLALPVIIIYPVCTALLGNLLTERQKRYRIADGLRINEEKFRSLFESAKDGIFILSAQGELIDLNSSFAAMHGYTVEEMRSMNLGDLDEPETSSKSSERIRRLMDGEALTFEVGHYCKDRRIIPLEVSTSLIMINGEKYILGFHRDISERKKGEQERLNLELQMQQAQKLESLGVLAGGIAHDFNNILMAILGNADLALMRINKESPATENLHRIEQAAARAADLAKQMLAYSGKGKFVVENIDLNILLQEMLHMLEVSISKKAVLRLNPYQSLPPVEADATQLRQIVMNLVINASEAIGDRSGVIAITTGCMDCDRNYLKDVWLDENISEGLYVYLEIADSGCGMDKDTMTKLFDPFFTTKFTGRGLGMAAVLGIVRGHKGAIKVYSELNKGTTFKILLPASSRPTELFNHDSRHDDWKGNGTVLLVDDEETIRGIGREMLQELGFKIITANDGREAVAVYKQNPGIDLVILDLTMPHMDGEQCFRELRQLNPDVKVIMSSGYNEQDVTQKFVGKGLAGFIQKPYKLSQLKDAIRALN